MLEMFLLKSFKIEKKVISFHLVVLEENTSKMLAVFGNSDSEHKGKSEERCHRV